MKLFKRFLILGCCVLILGVLAGCPSDDDNSDPADPIVGGAGTLKEGELLTGTAQGRADGFASNPLSEGWFFHDIPPGADVGVAVTMKNGYITNIVYDLEDESKDLGVVIANKIKPIIIKQNTFDIDRELRHLDAYSSATFTFDAIVEAGKKAIEKIANTP